jgi:NAD(P)-dependent dehydrogenase (short-subunit alcohol dehydrogenase family)
MKKQKSLKPPDEKTYFLVSGGGKGITAQNVIALAEAFHCQFLLLGRSQLLEKEPPWAAECETEEDLKQNAIQALEQNGEKPTPKEVEHAVGRILSSREIHTTMNAVTAHGGSAKYISADVTDLDQLYQALGDDRDRITGMVHGAGALADKYIEDKKEDDFDLVYGVKVDGLRNLLSIVPLEQLEYVILFSSVAGFYGNMGQADYAMGNEVLNKMAHSLKAQHPDCQVLALDWGPWDGGMVTPQLKRILARRNVDVIPIEIGTEILVNLISSSTDRPQWVIGSPLPKPTSSVDSKLRTYRIHRQISLEANPFLKDHVIGGRPVLPTVCAVGWIVNSCEGLYPNYRLYEIKDYKVFKGILFDETLANYYVLEMEEVEKSQNEITFKGIIRSETKDGLERKHYHAVVVLKRDLPDPPVLENVNLEREARIPGERLYENHVLFHGPRFQGVQEVIDHNPQNLTVRCCLPFIPVHEQGQFPADLYNPFITDTILQSLLIWSFQYRGVSGLPLRISRGRLYRPFPFETSIYATMEVISVSNHTLRADVTSYDEGGQIFMEVTGAEITLSERLNELFYQNQLREKPSWL